MEEESLPQNQQQRVRKERLERKNEEDMRRAARTAPGTSAQHAEEEVQPRRAGPDRPLGGKLPNKGNILN